MPAAPGPVPAPVAAGHFELFAAAAAEKSVGKVQSSADYAAAAVVAAERAAAVVAVVVEMVVVVVLAVVAVGTQWEELGHAVQ